MLTAFLNEATAIDFVSFQSIVVYMQSINICTTMNRPSPSKSRPHHAGVPMLYINADNSLRCIDCVAVHVPSKPPFFLPFLFS